MKNNAFVNFFNGVHKSIKRHSPEILTGIGIGGMITSIALAIKSTPKAMALIEDKKEKLNTDKLKPIEVLKTTWKCYIPSTLTCAASIGCIIGASAVNNKRNAALATAYSLSESALKLYQDKVIETIGEKEERKVRDAIAKEKIENHPVITKEVIITEKGNTLCFEAISGRYFKSDMETIKQAVNEINRRMLSEMSISLNDFFYELGLSPVKMGDELGWEVNHGMLELSFSSQIAADGTPCLVVDYAEPPRYDYDK